jgi:uncharacterized membrane protein
MSDRRIRAAVALLAIVGAGIAGYLTYAHVTNTPIACATGGCETVDRSRYSELGGIPVAAFGLAAYLALLGSATLRSARACAAGAAVALAGLAVAAYLLYVQLAVIDAVCQWCVTSDVVLLLLVPATMLRLRRADRAERRVYRGGSATA